MTDTKNFLENNMKSRRIKMGLSQRECAKKLGVSLVAYQNWEHGICSPKEDKMNMICDLFGFNKEQIA